LNTKKTGKQSAATAAAKAHASDASARTWNSTGKPVGAVVSGMAVLRAIHLAPHPLNASQVARAAGLYRGTAYNILQTLCSEGVVSYDPATKSYNISTQIFEMAHGVLRKSGLLDFVGRGFRIDSYFSVGRRSPRFSGAPGVLMAAFADVDLKYVKSQYQLTEWFRQPTFEEFVERMQTAKRDGYSVDYGDRRSGLTQVAVPIFSGATGKMALTITCIDFKRAFTHKRVQATAEAALACADRISSQLPKLQLD
jgi:DNA-binding IclR family transcriptional regulator